VTPCLFINKLDRLVLELGMSPSEAAQRLFEIVSHANMVVSAFQSEKYISEADSVLAYEQQQQQQSQNQG
jgi:ribosome assembly protein 1